MLNEPNYKPLLNYTRNSLIEQVHLGLIIRMNRNGVISKIGDDNCYKFYHRSCMKPMQASPLIDLKLNEKYNLTSQEIAVCCASHTGDLIHQKEINNILKKIELPENDLLCHPHEPLSKKEQERLIINHQQPSKIHNNCSGKHTAMLMIAKEMGFDISNYKDFENPLSKYILSVVSKLCETEDVVISKDGCGLPVIATSLEALGRGFLNLFCSDKYSEITNAFLNNPYLIGGDYRLDSEIINASEGLVAKVGACGLCVVVNLKKQECIIVKIADSNMEARTVVTLEALNQLKWPVDFTAGRITSMYCKDVVSQDGDILGMLDCCFSLV